MKLYKWDLYVNVISYSIYKYCLTCTDMYDIFIADYLPNDDTPRIAVQVRSYGLWVEGWEAMLLKSYEQLEFLLFELGCEIREVRENRIDYCYHTNAIKTPEKLFRDRHIGAIRIKPLKGIKGFWAVSMNIWKVKMLKDFRN